MVSLEGERERSGRTEEGGAYLFSFGRQEGGDASRKSQAPMEGGCVDREGDRGDVDDIDDIDDIDVRCRMLGIGEEF